VPREPRIFLPLVLCCLGLAGWVGYQARPRMGVLYGQVTIDGEAIERGSILIVSEQMSWATIGIIHHGEYRIDEIPPGQVRLGIAGDSVPWHYEDPSYSGLRFLIRPGRQRLELTLSWDASP
jgi:hypothetical protein